MRRMRGSLLIELSVAVGVAIAGIAATLARVQSTAKTGREIELMNQAVSDATGFAAWATNLHLMGGPNYVGNTSTVGDIATECLQWMQRNYPVNSLVQVGGSAAPTVQFNGYIWQLGTGLGTSSAVGDQNLVPAAGAELYFVQGVEITASLMGVVYMHGQAPLAKSVGGNPATIGVAFAAAGNTLYGGGAGAANVPPVGVGPTPTVQNGSRQAEAVQINLAEDPNTGIVTVVTPFAFTSVNLASAAPTVGSLFNASGLGTAGVNGLIVSPGAQALNSNQPNGF